MTIEGDIDAGAQDAIHLLNAIHHHDHDGRGLLARIRLGQNGHPRSASYEPSTTRNADPEPSHDWPDGIPAPTRSDPTGEAGIRPDRAANDLNEFARLAGTLQRTTARMIRIANAYTPRPPTLADQRALERANAVPDPGCTSCARTEAAKGVTRWEPIHRGDLCRWCYDWQRSHGEAPTVAQLRDHHAGKKVRVKAT